MVKLVRSVMIALIAVVAITAGGCAEKAPAAVTVTRADDSGSVRVANGGTVTVELPAVVSPSGPNASTDPVPGAWTAYAPPAVLRSVETSPASEPTGSGTVTFEYTAVQKGQGMLMLWYAPALPLAESPATFSVRVIVE